MPFKKERLKERRLLLDITLQEIADKLNVTKQTIHKYESGVISKIDILTVEKLAIIVKCEPSYLMGWQDEPNMPVVRNSRTTELSKNEHTTSTTKNSSVVDLSENKEETILDKYNMLDDIDKVKIEERIDTFLEDDKYKKELKQA